MGKPGTGITNNQVTLADALGNLFSLAVTSDGNGGWILTTSGGGGGGSTPTGSAGTPNAQVVSVQGINNGTPQTVQDVAAEAALGASTDTSWSGTGSGTLIAIGKSLYGKLAGVLSVTINGTQTVVDVAAEAALGAPADAAWGGTGNSSLVAGVKALWGLLNGTLKVAWTNQSVSLASGQTIALSTGSASIGALAASEAHIGEVGGNVGKAQVQFGAAATYTTGQAMSATQRLDNMARVANGTGLITSATLELAVANTVQVDLVFFSAAPTGTYAAGSTFTLNAADAVKVSKVIHLTDWTAPGASASLGEPSPAPKFFRCDDATNSQSLWVVPVARGSITLAASTDATLTVRASRN